MDFFIKLISLLFTLFDLLILARILLSWIPMDPYNPIVQFIHNTTEPLLAPIRRRLGATGGLDFSPMIVLLVAWVLQTVIINFLRGY